MSIRLTTFNCENLFGRFRFLDRPAATSTAANDVDYAKLIQVYDVGALAKGKRGAQSLKPQAIGAVQRVNTGGAILAAKPDILCVNEVENLATLRLFNARYVDNFFDRMILCEGNDPRGINVGVAIRRGAAVQIEGFRTHSDDASAGGFLLSSNRLSPTVLGAAVYSRDDLEVDLNVGGKALTLLVNHLKAQDVKGGLDTSTARRLGQAQKVAALVAAVRARGRVPIVLGDFNKDSRAPDYDHSLDPLVNHPALFDPFPALVAAGDLWSHYYSSEKKTSRLDYILVDQTLQGAVTGAEFYRLGLTPKCTQVVGARLNNLVDTEEASDHCPTTIVLNL
jgi:hypothetical protein